MEKHPGFYLYESANKLLSYFVFRCRESLGDGGPARLIRTKIMGSDQHMLPKGKNEMRFTLR